MRQFLFTVFFEEWNWIETLPHGKKKFSNFDYNASEDQNVKANINKQNSI